MKNNGWVRFYRKSFNSSVWKNPQIWWVWSWCLLKANHETHKFPFNGKDFEIKVGQFVTGRKKACKELKLTPQKYRTAILYLKNTSRITIKTTNKFSVISIVNWRKYQDNDKRNNQQNNQPITNQQPTNNQQITTYKNDKNDKNEEEEKPSSFKKKKKPFYEGQEMRKVRDKWFVIPKDGGTWLEYADKESKIEWRT